jgi:hypothetical protein
VTWPAASGLPNQLPDGERLPLGYPLTGVVAGEVQQLVRNRRDRERALE